MSFKWTHTALMLGTLVLFGCEKPTITVTEVPKPAERPTASMPIMPGMQEQAQSTDTPTWEVPEHWEAKPASAMRKGSWAITTADGSAEVSVLAFPGDVGGDLANINRWLNQIGQAPMDEATLEPLRQEGAVTIDGEGGFTIMLSGDPQSIYAAILKHGTHSWFFKMMGDTAVVESEVPAFNTFLQTVTFPK